MNFNQQLLIALPDMQDPRFAKAVILICEHNNEGAMGLMLNHPMKDIDIQQVFRDLRLNTPLNNKNVMDGGPLNKNSGFILHNNNQLFKSSIRVSDNLSLTTSKDILEQIALQQFSAPWQFYLGYSGWTKDQLEKEIAENTWLTCPIDLDLIFNTPIDELWQKTLSKIGIKDYQSISGIGHA